MYLWVVLTTFLAMIAAYYLPIRNDTADKRDVGVARAQLVQMVAKHKAVMQYMFENMYPYYCADGLDCNTDIEARRMVGYGAGYVTQDMIAPYFPKGFYNNPDYVSQIYCMKRYNNSGVYEDKGDGNVCHRNNDEPEYTTVRAVITYGAIPERWQVYSQNGDNIDIKPSTDLIAAMREQFARNEVAGYAFKNDEGKIIVMNFERTKFELPSPMIDESGTKGLTTCLNEYGTCLVYMSWR